MKEDSKEYRYSTCGKQLLLLGLRKHEWGRDKNLETFPLSRPPWKGAWLPGEDNAGGEESHEKAQLELVCRTGPLSGNVTGGCREEAGAGPWELARWAPLGLLHADLLAIGSKKNGMMESERTPRSGYGLVVSLQCPLLTEIVHYLKGRKWLGPQTVTAFLWKGSLQG